VRNTVRTLVVSMLGLFLAACGGGSGSPSNQSPASTPSATIKAVNGVGVSSSDGAVQALLGATIQLSGSANSTSTIASYLWTLTSKPSGSTATIATPSAVAASLKPDLDGSYTVQLEVTDANGITGTQSATIVVSGSIPVASVVATVQFNGTSTTKPSEAIDVGTVVALDASASSVPSGDAVSISFMMTTRPAGSSAALVSSDTSSRFTADVPGTYDVRVRATDQTGEYSDVIYVFQANPAPSAVIVASASPTTGASNVLNAATGYVVVLNGSGSASAAGDTVNYTWSLISKPAGSGAALSAATGASVNFIPDSVGNYMVSLVVTDASTGANSTFTTTVEASQGPTAVVSGSATPGRRGERPHLCILGRSTCDAARQRQLRVGWSITHLLVELDVGTGGQPCVDQCTSIGEYEVHSRRRRCVHRAVESDRPGRRIGDAIGHGQCRQLSADRGAESIPGFGTSGRHGERVGGHEF